MAEFCYACAAPLSSPDFKGPSADYCKYCTDEAGVLKSRDNVLGSIADWFMEWQPGLTREKALARAEHYMLSMPAWAED
jgi:hypothetical protein